MSEDEKIEDTKKGITNILDSIKKLKEANPKVLYGGVAAVVIILLIMMMSGGSETTVNSPATVNLAIGNNYVLREPNAYDSTTTIRLVSTPGSMAAYDDTDKEDREGCKHLPQGTPVVLKEFYSAYGKENTFSKVKVLSGECEGTIGWTLSINLGAK